MPAVQIRVDSLLTRCVLRFDNGCQLGDFVLDRINNRVEGDVIVCMSLVPDVIYNKWWKGKADLVLYDYRSTRAEIRMYSLRSSLGVYCALIMAVNLETLYLIASTTGWRVPDVIYNKWWKGKADLVLSDYRSTRAEIRDGSTPCEDLSVAFPLKRRGPQREGCSWSAK
jgi:hypothetical protein